MSGSIASVLDYLDRVDPAAARVARERYGCLTPWQKDPATYGRAAISSGLRRSSRSSGSDNGGTDILVCLTGHSCREE